MTTFEIPEAEAVSLPRTERTDAPAYLQRYLDRETRGGKPHEVVDRSTTDDDGQATPLYLRPFQLGAFAWLVSFSARQRLF